MKKYLYILILAGFMLNGCDSKKLCKKFPDAFLNAYFPYKMEQKVSFCNNNDTMNFFVNELYIFEDITFKSKPFCNCDAFGCPEIYVIMFDSIKNILLKYEIISKYEISYFNITLLYLSNEYYNRGEIGCMVKSFSNVTPYDIKNLDLYGETIVFDDYCHRPFYQADIVRYKGIAVLYEKTDTEEIKIWRLVE